MILRQPTNDIYFLKHSMHNSLLSFGGGTWTTTSFPQSAQAILYDFRRVERPGLGPRCLPYLLLCTILTSFLLFVYCLSQPFDSRPEDWACLRLECSTELTLKSQTEGSGLTLSGVFSPVLKGRAWAPSNGSN